MMKAASLLLTFVLLASVPLDAYPAFDCSTVVRWGSRGEISDLATAGGFAVAAEGRGAALYDIRNPELLRRLSLVETADPLLEVEVAGTSVFGLTRTAVEELAIEGERLVARGTIPGAADGLAASADLLVTFAGRELSIYTRAGGTFVMQRRTQLASAATAAALAGNRLAIAHGTSGTTIYDLTAGGFAAVTTLPVDARFLAAGSEGRIVAGGTNVITLIEAGGMPRIAGRVASGSWQIGRVALDGNVAAAVDGASGVVVVDFSDPGVPVVRASIEGPSRTVALTSAVVLTAPYVVDSFGHALASSTLLAAHSLTAPAVRLGTFASEAGPVAGVAASGTHAFVADPPMLRVIALDAPDGAREVGSLTLHRSFDRARLQGTTLLLYGREHVEIVDVSDPARPRQIGRYDTRGRPRSDAAFAGSRLVEANHASGFHLLDISNPLEPVQIGGLINDWHGTFQGILAALPSTAYAVARTGIKVIDLAAPPPLRYGVVIETGEVSGLEIAYGGTGVPLLVAIDSEALRLFDLSNPHSPLEVSSRSVERGTIAAAAGSTLWLASPSGRLATLDVRNPASPQLIGESGGLRAPSQLAATPRGVVVADRYELRYVRSAASASPAAPLLTLSPRSTRNAAELTWTATEGAQYEIETSGDSRFAGAQPAFSAEPALWLTPGAPIFVRVRTLDGCATGPWSNVVEVSAAAFPAVYFEERGRTVPLSAPRTISIPLRNSGGAVASVRVSIPAALGGDRQLTIAPGAREMLELTVSPAAAGSHTLSLDGGDTFALRIASLAPAAAPRLSGGSPVLLPAIARTPGAEGTLWRSDISLFCRSASCSAELRFVPQGAGDARSAALALTQGEVVTLEDVALSVFGLEQANGHVEIVAGTGAVLDARGTTYNDAPAGRYGQEIASWPASPAPRVSTRELLAVEQSAAARTNIGFVNTTATAQQLTLVAITAAGAAAAERSLLLAPAESAQYSLSQVFQDISEFAGVVRVTASDAVLAYASRADARSGDATFVYAKEHASITAPAGSGYESLIDVAASNQGAFGTRWRSAMQLFNSSGSDADVTLTIIPAADAVRAESRRFVVAPGSTVATSDAIATFFSTLDPLLTASAMIRISSSSPLGVWSRVYNDSADGHYGQYIPHRERPAGMRATGPEANRRFEKGASTSDLLSPLQLFPLAHDARVRTNVAIFDTAGAGGVVELRLFDRSGARLAAAAAEIGPWQSISLHSIIEVLGFAGLQDLRIELVRGESSRGVAAWASVAESATGDAAFIATE
jgi:hypothetical protein